MAGRWCHSLTWTLMIIWNEKPCFQIPCLIYSLLQNSRPSYTHFYSIISSSSFSIPVLHPSKGTEVHSWQFLHECSNSCYFIWLGCFQVLFTKILLLTLIHWAYSVWILRAFIGSNHMTFFSYKHVISNLQMVWVAKFICMAAVWSAEWLLGSKASP